MMISPHAHGTTVIESWLLSNIKNRGYERDDELHIDRIDQKWQGRESWFSGGLDAFRIAVGIRDKLAPGFSIAVAFSLTADLRPYNRDFRKLTEIEAELSSPPPSLYLFQKGDEPWMRTDSSSRNEKADEVIVRELSHDTFSGLTEGTHSYYVEFRQVEFDEYSRSVFVAG